MVWFQVGDNFQGDYYAPYGTGSTDSAKRVHLSMRIWHQEKPTTYVVRLTAQVVGDGAYVHARQVMINYLAAPETTDGFDEPD